MRTDAFAVYLIQRLGSIKGKKAFQKLVYLAQVIGIPLDKSYRMHYYGPYSEQVADDMNEMVRDQIISHLGANTYAEGRNSEEVINESADEINQYNQEFETLIDLFGDMSPRELEIYATAHFVDLSFNNLHGISDRDKIIEETKKAKYPKFSMEEINSAYNQLEEWDLL